MGRDIKTMQMLIPLPKPLMHLYAYFLIYLFYCVQMDS